MSGHQTATIEDTVYFWFAANDTSGSGGDGATPLFDVREAGAAANAAPLLSGTPALLSHADYPAGCYEIAVAATAANGFAADDTFSVFCTLAVDSQNPTGLVGSCTLTPLAKDAAVLKPTVAGRTLDVTAAGEAGLDFDNTVGTLAAAQFATAFITASKFAANAIDAAAISADFTTEIVAGMNDLSTADIDARLVAIGLDHLISASVTGTDITDNSIFARLVSASATADWDDFVNTDDSLQAIRDRGDAGWTTGAGGADKLVLADTTIATLATQISFTLTAGSADDNAYNNCTIVVEDAATATQKAVGVILAYTGSTKTVTLKEALAFAIATTDKVYILAEGSLKSTVANRQLDVNATGESGIDLDNTSGAMAANQFATGFITASKFAAGAIDAAAISADFTTEVMADWQDGNRLDLLLDAIKAVTDGQAATGTGLSAIPWNAAWDAQVESEVNDALVALKLDHLVAVADADDPVNDSIMAKLAATAGDWSAFVKGTDSLQAIRDHIGDGTNLPEAGGTGDHLTALPWNSAWDAEVQSEVNDALDEVIPELGVAAPAATPTIRTAIMLPYMGLRNKRLTDADQDDIYNDAGTVICSAVLSDDTLEFISGEFA